MQHVFTSLGIITFIRPGQKKHWPFGALGALGRCVYSRDPCEREIAECSLRILLDPETCPHKDKTNIRQGWHDVNCIVMYRSRKAGMFKLWSKDCEILIRLKLGNCLVMTKNVVSISHWAHNNENKDLKTLI